MGYSCENCVGVLLLLADLSGKLLQHRGNTDERRIGFRNNKGRYLFKVICEAALLLEALPER